jgi:hypothetical protein
MTTEEYLTTAGQILSKIKTLATKYHSLTGRPLGVTGEIAEYEAVRLLKLDVSQVRQTGFDAIRKTKKGVNKIQIKGRVFQPTSKKGQRLGAIQLDKEWDSVILVMMDNKFSPTEIYEADRAVVEAALKEPGSKARNERGQLSVSKFKSISSPIWTNK